MPQLLEWLAVGFPELGLEVALMAAQAPWSGCSNDQGSLAHSCAKSMIRSITGWNCLWPNITAAEHGLLGQLLGLGLDHHDRVARAGDDEVEVALVRVCSIVGLRMNSPFT